MEKSKTLLEKYQIPLNHLDFEYVKSCENAREMEKIVMILRSGEEGFFPDLTRCAEEKLKQLKPQSKLFRTEEQIQRSDMMDKKELKPIYDWTHDIKNKDSTLNELKEEASKLAIDLPPVRKPAKIEIDKDGQETQKPNAATKPSTNPQKKSTNEQRIKSTDYSKWDKYDPDEEILRMDLEQEREKEQAEIQLKKKLKPVDQQQAKVPSTDEERLQALLQQLSQLEREQFSEKFRLRGNEYFKAREYDNAIQEYSRAILYDPAQAARAYNNRAISFLKQKKYLPAIDDCEACLRLEPDNVKALLRLADANYGQGRRRESYSLYQRVLQLEPGNASAKKALEELRLQIGELPPKHATRLIIEELPPDKPVSEVKPLLKPDQQQKKQPKQQQAPPQKEYDLSELVKPNRVVKSKLSCAAEALDGTLKGKNPVAQAQKQQLQQMMQQMSTAQPQLNLLHQANAPSNSRKVLIEEIQ